VPQQNDLNQWNVGWFEEIFREGVTYMPRRERTVQMENPRPHPVEGAVFEANVRVAGLQYKRVSGVEYAQITVLVPWSPDINARAGAIAGKVCAFSAREVVDPTLDGILPEDPRSDTRDRQTVLELGPGHIVVADEGDDGIPSDQ
jgi:hypothetical protein